MQNKFRLYIALVAAAILVAVLVLLPNLQEAKPVIEVLPTPTPVAVPIVPATPEPTPPPAITPPADNAASGSDLVLQPIDPATDSDLSVITPDPATDSSLPSPEETPTVEESPAPTAPVATP